MSPTECNSFYETTPQAIADFIAAKVVVGDFALPYHYPEPNELEAWQIGFRIHGLTGESLVSTMRGGLAAGMVCDRQKLFW